MSGIPVLISDVADVNTGFQQRQGMVGMDGKDDIVNGTILMRKGENPSVVLAGVKAKIDELNNSILPKGVEVVPYYDRAWLIGQHAAHGIQEPRRRRAAGLPRAVSISGKIPACGDCGRRHSAGAACDVYRTSSEGHSRQFAFARAPWTSASSWMAPSSSSRISSAAYRTTSTRIGSFKELVAEAAAEVGRPTFFSMLIIIIAHIPIFTLQRHEGRIFAPMAYTITSALIGSLLFSLTLVPVLCVYLMRRGEEEKENVIVRYAHRAYRAVLTPALSRPRIVLLVAGVALVATLMLVPQLGSEFLPELNEGSIWVNFTLPPGIAPGEVNRTLHHVREELLGIPEVERVVSQAGRPDDGTDPKPINMTEVLVDLKPEEQWRPHVTKEQLIAQDGEDAR